MGHHCHAGSPRADVALPAPRVTNPSPLSVLLGVRRSLPGLSEEGSLQPSKPGCGGGEMQVTNPSQMDLPHLDLHMWLYWGIFGRSRVFNRFSCLLGGPSFPLMPPKLNSSKLLSSEASLPREWLRLPHLTAGPSTLHAQRCWVLKRAIHWFPFHHNEQDWSVSADLTQQLPPPLVDTSQVSPKLLETPVSTAGGCSVLSTDVSCTKDRRWVPPCRALASATASSPR